MAVHTVPFSKLVASDAINARAETKDGIDELAASIAAKGIIQPLCVRPADDGRYEVIDGRRRHQAIAKLVKAKTWKKDAAIPVLVRNEDDGEALETSLMANTVRLPMHAVDQFAVFARLAAQNQSPADLASRFGVPVRVVRQRLALGRLAPTVLAAWKAGKIDDKTAQAFCGHADHEVQSALYDKLAKERHYGGVLEWRVRQEFSTSRERVDQSDELALIGEDTYLAAGGTIDDDLFNDARYVGDVPLLKKLARERLQAECAALVAGGWQWAQIEDTLAPPTKWWAWDNVKGEDFDAEQTDFDPAAWTAEERARSGCVLRIMSGDPGEASIQVIAGLIRPDVSGQTELEAAIDAASGRLPGGVSDAASEEPCPDCAGVDSDGCMTCHGTGTVEPEEEDLPAVGAMTGNADDEDEGGATISGALLETITTAQTEAAKEALLADPKLALRLVIAALGTKIWNSPVKIRIDVERSMPQPDLVEFADNCYLSDVGDVTLFRSLAERVASALDLVARHGNATREAAELLVDMLPADAYLEAARRHFLVEDFFKRASKAVAFEALDEMAEVGAVPSAQVEALADARKADLAAFTTEAARACGWLPIAIRHTDYALLVPEPVASRLTGKVAASEQSSEAA